MILIPIGVILWIVGSIVGPYGIETTGWWIFTTTTRTWLYWVGLILVIIGMVAVISGVSGIVISGVLEILDRRSEH